jgi:carbohydrate-selective porin OprB
VPRRGLWQVWPGTPGQAWGRLRHAGPLCGIVEAGYRLDQDTGSAGLPGNYKIGLYVDHTFRDLFRDVRGGSAALSGLPRRTTRGNAGFVVRPGGTGNIPDALVLGLQFAVTF